jgi:hypothetical protein
MTDPDGFDLRPVEKHIVATHEELRDSKHVPNVRVIWRATKEPETPATGDLPG